MPADRRDMPPVRLLPEPELARLVLAAPIVDRAARLARWCAPGVPVDAGAELDDEQLLRAVAALALDQQPDGLAETAEAWDFAVRTGLVEVAPADPADADREAAGSAAPGKALELLGGDPRGVLEMWRTGLDAVIADAVTASVLDTLGPLDLFGDEAPPGAVPPHSADGEAEAAFLDGALANLYLLTALEELDARRGGVDPAAAFAPAGDTARAVPLPVLAASMVVPDDMEVPTDAVLEEVSEAMMRLDDHFRLLASTGLVDYQPVDDALIAEDAEAAEMTATAEDTEDAVYAEAAEGPEGAERAAGGGEAAGDLAGAGSGPLRGLQPGAEPPPEPDEAEVARYGLVRLTPLGVLGVRGRLLESGVAAPALGDLTGREAAVLLEALVDYPESAAVEEADHWLAGRDPVAAAREVLAAARGAGPGAPARRLACQQTLSRLGPAAEPAVREVLDDRELGGLARVWLVERNASDVPAPDEAMVYWLTIDTLAAQVHLNDDLEVLSGLVRDLVARHPGFFEAAWRVDHPDTADVLEAVGRLHDDRTVAKEARKAAFKARSAR